MWRSLLRLLQGVGRFELRRLVIDACSRQNLYRGRKDHAMKLARCSRTGDILEPRLKPQWLVGSVSGEGGIVECFALGFLIASSSLVWLPAL